MFYEAYRGKWLCPILYNYFLVFSQFLVKAISGRAAVGLKRDCCSSHLTNAFSLARSPLREIQPTSPLMTKSGGSPKPSWFLSAVTSHDQSQLHVQERRDPAWAALCTVGLLSALVISLFLRLLLPAALSLFPQLPPSYGAGRATGRTMSGKGTCTSLPLRARKQQRLSPSVPPLEWFTGSRGV